MEETGSVPDKTRGIAFVLLLVILVGAALFVLLRGLPFGESSKVLIAEGFPAERLYAVSGSGSLKEIAKSVPGTLEDYAKGGGKEIALVRTDVGAFEVYELSRESRALTTNGTRKSSLAVSPDGRWAAYAELLELDPSLLERTSSWMVSLLDLESGEATALTPGFAPQFFTRDGSIHLLYTSPEGLTLGDPAQATTQTLPLSVSQNIHAPIVVSEDGTQVALRDDAARIYSVFALEALSPITINPTRSLPREAEAVVFFGAELLGLVYKEETRFVRYGALNEEKDKELSVLPESELFYFLLP